MGLRTIARENRLAAAIEGLSQVRARSFGVPNTLTERQPRDRRLRRFDSTKPVAVLATVEAVSSQLNVNQINSAASGGSSGGGGGYYGGGQPINSSR